MGGGFLVNGDRWTQTFNRVHIGLVQLPQKLPGVSAKGFHITALPLRKNRVKRQGRLPRTRHPRKHNQLVTRQIEIHIF